ncbi:MAG TPA: hypothetical protein VJK71_02845 [Gemmatimonadales bacterium]|nr:hypothetical protein [Gemmatimonadales bacterium]
MDARVGASFDPGDPGLGNREDAGQLLLRAPARLSELGPGALRWELLDDATIPALSKALAE